jgi:hypothetical protein
MGTLGLDGDQDLLRSVNTCNSLTYSQRYAAVTPGRLLIDEALVPEFKDERHPDLPGLSPATEFWFSDCRLNSLFTA